MAKKGTPVWWREKDIVGRIVNTIGEKAMVFFPGEKDMNVKVIEYDKIIPLVKAPIDGKNVAFEWIEECLLEDATAHGDEYLGWIDDEPVYASVNKLGSLLIKAINNPKAINGACIKINEMFSQNNESPFVQRFIVSEDKMSVVVLFYFLEDGYEK